MSVHSSLAKKGLGAVHRNVFKRFERLMLLKKSMEQKEGSTADTRLSVLGLPKVRSIKIKK